jgi:hypothetical protein
VAGTYLIVTRASCRATTVRCFHIAKFAKGDRIIVVVTSHDEVKAVTSILIIVTVSSLPERSPRICVLQEGASHGQARIPLIDITKYHPI